LGLRDLGATQIQAERNPGATELRPRRKRDSPILRVMATMTLSPVKEAIGGPKLPQTPPAPAR